MKIVFDIVKVVDYVHETGTDDALCTFATGFCSRFRIRTACRGLGRFRFLDLKIVQIDDNTSSTDGDEKHFCALAFMERSAQSFLSHRYDTPS